MRLRDVAAGLLAPLVRVHRQEGAIKVWTPLGYAIAADPGRCDESSTDVGRAYMVGPHAFPKPLFRRIGELDVLVQPTIQRGAP